MPYGNIERLFQGHSMKDRLVVKEMGYRDSDNTRTQEKAEVVLYWELALNKQDSTGQVDSLQILAHFPRKVPRKAVEGR